MSSIILLEPYRSALFAEGLDEGLVRISGDVNPDNSPAIQIGRNRELQLHVREIALFYDDLFVIHHEQENTADEALERDIPTLSALNLKYSGVARFPENKTDSSRVDKLKEMKSIFDWWQIEKDLINKWIPVIGSQLVARGKLPHVSLIYVLQAHRERDEKKYLSACEKVPEEYKNQIQKVLQDLEPFGYDFLAFSTLNELSSVDTTIETHRSHLAIDKIFSSSFKHVSPDKANGAVQIVIESLLQEELRFPVPNSLMELVTLKQREEMKSFRNTFRPWLESLSLGNTEDENKLRKEVKKAMFQFRNAPRLTTASKITGILSVPAGLVGPTGTVAGAILGLSSMGLSEWSSRWQEENKWVSICAE